MENRADKLATLALASVAFVGATAVIEPQPASASFSPSEKIFEVRKQSNVRPDEIPLPVENRSASPMPFGGNEFGDDPMDTLVTTVTRTPPPAPELIDDAPAPVSRQSFSALTSFDESLELTSGDHRASNAARTFPPPPAQWNNPIEWLATHKE